MEGVLLGIRHILSNHVICLPLRMGPLKGCMIGFAGKNMCLCVFKESQKKKKKMGIVVMILLVFYEAQILLDSFCCFNILMLGGKG
jgi:hypothetical protein